MIVPKSEKPGAAWEEKDGSPGIERAPFSGERFCNGLLSCNMLTGFKEWREHLLGAI